MPEEQVTVTKPAPFIEAAGTILTEKLMEQLGPTGAIDYSSFYEIDPETGKPIQVAEETALQEGAYKSAAGLGSLLGPDAYKPYMSPYQEEVIKATEAGLERQKAKAMRDLSAQAIGAGAFGGAREGVARGEYLAAQDVAAQQALAQLRQAGFESAQQQALQQLAASQGLGQYQQQMGLAQQAQQQAIIDAANLAAQQEAFGGQQQLGFVGQQLTGLMGGYPAQSTFQTTTTPPPSPLSQALGIGAGLAGIGGQLGLFG